MVEARVLDLIVLQQLVRPIFYFKHNKFYFHVGYGIKIKFHNIKLCVARSEGNYKYSFFFFFMGRDFGGIVHMKLGFIVLQKIKVFRKVHDGINKLRTFPNF